MVYLVEDDRNARDLVVYTLGSTGSEAFGCEDDKALHTEMAKTRPGPVLLNITLPGTDGTQVLCCLKADRSTADTPIITVTARGAESEKVKSLDLGADDYMTRPLGMTEPVSRVRAVLWCSSWSVQDSAEEEILILGLISLNLSGYAAVVNGETVTLILREYQLLEELITQPGSIFSRDQLLDSTWGYPSHGEARAVDVYIRTLRKKLGEVAKYIKAVWGVRYKVPSQGN